MTNSEILDENYILAHELSLGTKPSKANVQTESDRFKLKTIRQALYLSRIASIELESRVQEGK